MIEPNWEQIAAVLHSFTHEQDRKIPPEEIKALVVGLHGWEAVGAIISAFDDHRTMCTLVRAGVPIDVAARQFVGKRECVTG